MRINRMAQQRVAIADLGRGLMRACEEHQRRSVGIECFLPACRADAPAVARTQPDEPFSRRRQIVPARLRELEELRRDLDANDVATDIVLVGLAAARAEPTCPRFERARLQRLAEQVAL